MASSGDAMLWLEDSGWPPIAAVVFFLLVALSHTPEIPVQAAFHWIIVVPLIATLIYFLTQEIPVITTIVLLLLVVDVVVNLFV